MKKRNDGSLNLMPPRAAAVKHDQIAAVLTCIRRAWGNMASPVSHGEDKETRQPTSGWEMLFADQELARFTDGGRGGRGRGN